MATIQAAIRFRNSRKEVKSLKEKGAKSENSGKKGGTVIIGESASFREVLDIVAKVAKTDANVLITGENGTGKEVLPVNFTDDRCGQMRSWCMSTWVLSRNAVWSELFRACEGTFRCQGIVLASLKQQRQHALYG
ncbi:MAG: sigma 54-interacting transcriptional regulator [Bacteroidales bacterium]|nr:sigma 54-interacting transcriptional regulator [Bacteroidales bacterium]